MVKMANFDISTMKIKIKKQRGKETAEGPENVWLACLGKEKFCGSPEAGDRRGSRKPPSAGE